MEHKGYWQDIKYTNKGDPYVSYQGRRFKVDLFTNWCGASEYYTYQEGLSVYILEVDERGDKARVTMCY